MRPSWLPPLIELSSYGGNWEDYLEAIYHKYIDDFHTPPNSNYLGERISAKKMPTIEGKSGTFWHMTGNGDHAEKIPDMDRCARIAWARAIIDNNTDPDVLVWRESGYSGGDRTILWLHKHDYAVVLAHRNGYVLLWTAYITNYPNQRRKFMQRYQRYKQTSP